VALMLDQNKIEDDPQESDHAHQKSARDDLHRLQNRMGNGYS
jgi:hypothetical protein